MTAPGDEAWLRLKELFKAALACPPDERMAYIEQTCGGDPQLRSQLEELLSSHQAGQRPGERSPFSTAEWREGLEDPAEPLPSSIARYRILGVIASGGMGTVYRAEQENPRRTVAVKVIRRGIASRSTLKRFEYEALLLAKLRHPGIAQVYEAGTHNDGSGPVPYFAMEYIPEARPITTYAVQEKLALHQRLTLFAQVCDAVQHGHQKAIIHRDLKPSNILVDAQGQPRVIDFGVARSTDADLARTSLQTEVGQLIGTLQYMSPEQCQEDPHAIDTRSDIYSLGVVLYEMVSEKLPYDLSGLPIYEATRMVREAVPPRLGALDRRWTGDIETIVAKAMEKERNRRYGSAAEMAEDLRRHLTGEAILARPTSIAYQLRTFARRNKALVGGVFVLILALAIGIAGTGIGLFRERRAQRRTEEALFDMVTAYGLEATDRGHPAQALLWFVRAASLAAEDVERQSANQVRLRTWRRRIATPVNLLEHPGGDIQGLVFHPRGTHLLVTAGSEKSKSSCKVWDLQEEKPLTLPGGADAIACAWSPDGGCLAAAMPEGHLEFLAVPGGERLRPPVPTGKLHLLAYSPQGRHLALAGDDVRLWDCEAARFTGPVFPHPGRVDRLSFSSSGELLATGCEDGKVRVFAVPEQGGDARPLFEPVENHRPRLEAYLPLFLGNRGFLTLSRRNEVCFREARTGEVLRTFTHWDTSQESEVYSVAASPDGRRLAIAGTRGTQLWDLETGLACGPPLRHLGRAEGVDFSADGSWLLSGGLEHRARIWSVPGGSLLTSIPHQDGIRKVRFSPRGAFLATAQYAGLVRVWRLEENHPLDHRLEWGDASSYLALSDDGTHLMPIGLREKSLLKETRVHEVSTGKPAGPALKPVGSIVGGDLSSEGRAVTLSVAGGSARLQCWDWRAGEKLGEPFLLPSSPSGCSFAPHGKEVGIICQEGEVLLFDPERGTCRRLDHGGPTFPYFLENPTGIEFAIDGRTFVTWGETGVKVWNAVGAADRFTMEHLLCSLARFSLDGGRLVTASSSDGSVRVWELEGGRELLRLEQPDGVTGACFDSGGALLATACDDNFARVWDLEAKELFCPPMEHEGRVSAIQFSRDGRWLFTVSHAGTLHTWETRTGREASPPRPLLGFSPQLFLTDDGDHLVVPDGLGGTGAEVFFLEDLRSGAEEDPQRLRSLAEVLAGQSLKGSGLYNMTAEEWKERFRSTRRD